MKFAFALAPVPLALALALGACTPKPPDTDQNAQATINALVKVGEAAGAAAAVLNQKSDELRLKAARTDVNNLMQALMLYKLDNQRYPSAEQGLQALASKPTVGIIPPNWKPYLDKLPDDPWGHPFQYKNPGDVGEIDIYSWGPAGPADGKGPTVIGSWQ